MLSGQSRRSNQAAEAPPSREHLGSPPAAHGCALQREPGYCSATAFSGYFSSWNCQVFISSYSKDVMAAKITIWTEGFFSNSAETQ